MKTLDKEIGKIYQTKEYEKFVIYDWNRTIDKQTLNKINKSVQEHGWKVEPIIVNEKYGIIDGQHRFTYAKEHNLPVYYIVIKGLTKEDCQIMNSVRTSWKQQDYVNFYAMQGNKNYIFLKALDNMFDNFGLPIITYAINQECYGGATTKILQDGTFKCTNEQYSDAIEILNYLNGLHEYIKKVVGRKVQLCMAITFCYRHPKIDNERLAQKIVENCNTMSAIADMETALKELERIYNYNLKQKSKIVYILTEYKKMKNAM